MFRAVAVAALLAGAIGGATASDYNEFRVGDWEGRAHRSDDSGEFTYCGITVRQPDGTFFTFAISRDNLFTVFFGDYVWHLPKDSRYQVELFLDGDSLGEFTAYATGDITLRIPFGTERILFGTLRLNMRLTIKSALRDFVFPVTGTSSALTRLQECADGERATARADGRNPFKPGDASGDSPKPSEPSRNPFKPNDSPDNSVKPDAPSSNPFRPAPRGFTRKEVTHILSKAGIRNPEFMSDDEVKRYPGFDYLWTMAGKIGFVSQFLRNPDESVDGLMARYMATLTHECRGKASAADKPAIARGPIVLKESAVFCVGQEDFHAYAVALFLPSKVSVFGFMGWGTENRATTAAATEKLASGLRQLYFLD